MTTGDPVALDTNVLVHADNPSSRHHERAAAIVRDALGGRFRAYVTPQVLCEYYSVVTSGRRVPHPLAPAEAAIRVQALIRSRRLKKIHPKRGTLTRCMAGCATEGVAGARVFDRLLAATILDGGVARLLTHNVKDFTGISGLKVENPFA